MHLSSFLSKRFNQPVTLVGASRTDTGVHARGQAIYFDIIDTTTTTNNNSSNILVKPPLVPNVNCTPIVYFNLHGTVIPYKDTLVLASIMLSWTSLN